MANRFSEQLEKIVRGSNRPMGFSQTVAAVKPRLFVMAEAPDLENGASLPGVDAVLTITPCKCKGKKSGALRGCAVSGTSEHSGCDFVVFNLDGAVAAEGGEETARLIRIEPDLTDAQLRAVGGLDMAAVIAEFGLGDALTFRDLLSVQRLADFCGRQPILLKIAQLYSKVELQSLWDRGITGIVFDAGIIDAAKLRELVDSLEPRKRTKEKSTAIVSQPPPVAAPAEDDPETEPEEDD
ncbi:hypothetical protein DGWBC_1463 [Dehalogenimonas sp. WBC-2]|nr:hypothetical protein DGWBC_1463 [Dehalogenimonas sp. WBC-2]